MTPDAWRSGEVAIIGLGTTGVAVGKFLAAAGLSVYASDRSESAAVRAAADQLLEDNVAAECGGHDLARITRAVGVVVSPGIPPKAPPVQAAVRAGVDVWSEIDLASLSLAGRPVLAVTGTNGKTTTTALIDHILRQAGIASVAAGNIGVPLITAVQDSAIQWFVVELSSFQLHYSHRLIPTVGVLTNLAPDHMDWYETTDDYYADKRRMFMHATNSSCWVVNGEDEAVMRMVSGVEGHVERFGIRAVADAWFDRRDGTMRLGGEPLLDRAAYGLLGDHNLANGLAASLVARRVGLNTRQIAQGLETMEALPHRLETVRVKGDVRWINDSKATNVASARAALQALGANVVLILGGRGKGEDFGLLADVLGSTTRAIIAYGEAAPTIVHQLSGLAIKHVSRLDDAVAYANDVARAGDAVLLSPACASFDQYENYMHRGDAFRSLVQRL